MAWTDTPTPRQIAILTDYFDEYIEDEIDNTNDEKVLEGLRRLYKENLVELFIKYHIHTRKEASDAIAAAEKYPNYQLHPGVKKEIDDFLESYGGAINYERVRAENRRNHEMSVVRQ